MELLSVFIFAFALSLDGFGAGIAYGIRKIRIPLHCLLVINLTSSAALALSMVAGHFMARFVTNGFSTWFGATILITVGIWTVFQTWFKRKDKPETFSENNRFTDEIIAVKDNKNVTGLKINSFSFVNQVFREPIKADIDLSGYLSTKESLLLGLALAMDAMGAGFGLAMSGFKPILAPLVIGIVQFLMIQSGLYLGRKYCAGWLGNKAAMLPGWILIAIGVSKFVKF